MGEKHNYLHGSYHGTTEGNANVNEQHQSDGRFLRYDVHVH